MAHGCSLPGSSVCGILQASILECVTIPFSRGSSKPRDRTQVSCIGRQILYCLSHQGKAAEASGMKVVLNSSSEPKSRRAQGRPSATERFPGDPGVMPRSAASHLNSAVNAEARVPPRRVLAPPLSPQEAHTAITASAGPCLLLGSEQPVL